MKHHKKRHTFLTIIGILFLITIIILSIRYQKVLGNKEIMSQFLEEVGIWGPLILITILIIYGVFSFFSSNVIMIVAGMIFGLMGFVYSLIGLLIGSILAFFIGKKYGRALEQQLISKKELNYVDKLFEKHGPFVALFGRFVAPIPGDVISLGSGVTKMKFSRYFVLTLIGYVISASITTFIGIKIAAGIF